MTAPIELSIVTTLYRSAATIDEFVRRTIAAATRVTENFELIIVDDGSPDDSLGRAIAHAKSDPRIKVVELSRNFGHHKALMTGLMYARGNYSFLIDSDLEEDPELLVQFKTVLEDSDVDVVYGYQTRRKGGLLERTAGRFAYWLFDLMLSHPVPLNAATIRLMTRGYVDSLLLHREQQTVIGGLWVLTGYRQLGVPIEKKGRPETTYHLLRRWRALIDSISAFSEIPLVAIFYLGVGISTLSVLVSLWVFISRIIQGNAIAGWVSVMLSVWFLGGILIFCVGIIGIYISKIFIETKNRPYTIVRRLHGEEPQSHARSTPEISFGISKREPHSGEA